MKKLGVFVLILLCLSLFSLAIVHGDDSMPSVPGGTGSEDMEDIQGAINQIPIDESGGIDNTKISGFKSKAEQRIAVINEYVGPISKALFGVEISLSWLFCFSVFFWIILVVIGANPAQAIFKLNSVLGLLFGMVFATLVMQTLGKKFTTWLVTVATTWYYAGLIFVIGTTIIVVYVFIIHLLGKKILEGKQESRMQKVEWQGKKTDMVWDKVIRGGKK